MTSDKDEMLAAIGEQMDQHHAEIRQALAEAFERMDRHFDQIYRKCDGINTILDRIDENIDAMKKDRS
jgi:hypothetical protein